MEAAAERKIRVAIDSNAVFSHVQPAIKVKQQLSITTGNVQPCFMIFTSHQRCRFMMCAECIKAAALQGERMQNPGVLVF